MCWDALIENSTTIYIIVDSVATASPLSFQTIAREILFLGSFCSLKQQQCCSVSSLCNSMVLYLFNYTNMGTTFETRTCCSWLPHWFQRCVPRRCVCKTLCAEREQRLLILCSLASKQTNTTRSLHRYGSPDWFCTTTQTIEQARRTKHLQLLTK